MDVVRPVPPAPVVPGLGGGLRPREDESGQPKRCVTGRLLLLVSVRHRVLAGWVCLFS